MLEQDLRTQLSVARNEINNLRQQVRNLQHIQRKDVESITKVLNNYRCEGCKQSVQHLNHNAEEVETPARAAPVHNGIVATTETFKPIGIIRSAFLEKRAVPRQTAVCRRLRSLIQFNADVFTNPAHALEGLAEFSHLWIIYHFHRNNSHPKAKVSPPRLYGERVGVFSTRSPHRPCPIGLSLVEIERIEGATISFYGTDMVDGTPVLDIKPYIPFYDAPLLDTNLGGLSLSGTSNTEHNDFYGSRQEPDGEESDTELFGAVGHTTSNSIHDIATHTTTASTAASFMSLPPPPSAVRVPSWITASHKLKVCFNERAESQLRDLNVQKQCITDILEADPRSVYLRTKYGSQIFTFQLGEVNVTCKFDDKVDTVTVVQVRRNEHVQDVKAAPATTSTVTATSKTTTIKTPATTNEN